MLLAQIKIFFRVAVDLLRPLPFLFLSLSSYGHTQDSLKSFRFLAMHLMPLSGNKTVLQGEESI